MDKSLRVGVVEVGKREGCSPWMGFKTVHKSQITKEKKKKKERTPK